MPVVKAIEREMGDDEQLRAAANQIARAERMSNGSARTAGVQRVAKSQSTVACSSLSAYKPPGSFKAT